MGLVALFKGSLGDAKGRGLPGSGAPVKNTRCRNVNEHIEYGGGWRNHNFEKGHCHNSVWNFVNSSWLVSL